MSTDTRTTSPAVGARVELARYTLTSGERAIIGQRIDGHVRLTDCPTAGGGRSYLIERELDHDGKAAMDALVADYLDQAHIHDSIPMASGSERYSRARQEP